MALRRMKLHASCHLHLGSVRTNVALGSAELRIVGGEACHGEIALALPGVAVNCIWANRSNNYGTTDSVMHRDTVD